MFEKRKKMESEYLKIKLIMEILIEMKVEFIVLLLRQIEH